ncbi:helix-turn-helix transcriptional regulator [Leucobacter insecticola]|uniref:helix-turn-helix transcriptional regulator n=1 Tax=Leucobacter insecticola TaxID=2714934 RepID=UPI001FCA8EC1|nr:WYL domain-containing protein [Leucobacter insecticola]
MRTIKRDLTALENSGVPIWARPGPGGGYGLANRATLPPVSLTPAQAVALLAAVSIASEATYADLARSGVNKILDVLDPGTRAQANELARRIWVNKAPSLSRVVRSAIEEAMLDQRVARIHYLSGSGAETVREVEPIMFGARNDRWYLIGWCRLRDEVRWFLVERIQRANVTATPCSGHEIHEVGEPPVTARHVGG